MLTKVIHTIGRFFFTVIFGVSPVEQIPENQSIVVANHNTHMDILILLRLFPLSNVDNVKIIAAKDYFSKGIQGFLGRVFFNLILIDRKSRKVDTALAPLQEALRSGYSIIIFPEGTRGNPGVLQRFKTGVGKLALEFPNLPVYPVHLEGIEKTLPRGRFLPVPFNIKLNVSQPIYGRDYLGDNNSQGRKLFTAVLEEKIRKMNPMD